MCFSQYTSRSLWSKLTQIVIKWASGHFIFPRAAGGRWPSCDVLTVLFLYIWYTTHLHTRQVIHGDVLYLRKLREGVLRGGWGGIFYVYSDGPYNLPQDEGDWNLHVLGPSEFISCNDVQRVVKPLKSYQLPLSPKPRICLIILTDPPPPHALPIAPAGGRGPS